MKWLLNKVKTHRDAICIALLALYATGAQALGLPHGDISGYACILGFGLVQIKYPTIQDFAENAVGIKDKIELIWQPLYDWVLFPTAGAALIPFFQVPQGQGWSAQPLAAAAVKTVADTNLTQPGLLPSPQCFWVDGIEVYFDPGAVATANLFAHAIPTVYLGTAAAASTVNLNDCNMVLRSGTLSFTIMQKEYYRDGPLYRLPPRAFMEYHGNQSICGTNAQPGSLSTMGAHGNGSCVRFEPGYGIKETTNFGVTIGFTPPVVTTAPGSGFNGRLGVFLNGWLFRGAQ